MMGRPYDFELYTERLPRISSEVNSRAGLGLLLTQYVPLFTTPDQLRIILAVNYSKSQSIALILLSNNRHK